MFEVLKNFQIFVNVFLKENWPTHFRYITPHSKYKQGRKNNFFSDRNKKEVIVQFES